MNESQVVTAAAQVTPEMKSAAEMAEHLSKTLTAIPCVESVSLVLTWKDEKIFPVGVISTATNLVRPSVILRAIKSLNQFATTLSDRLLTAMLSGNTEKPSGMPIGTPLALPGHAQEANTVQPQ